MKIGITSDSSSSLLYPPFDTKIKITKTTIRFGETIYMDGVNITPDEFYEKLNAADIVPTTAAPTPEEIIDCTNEYVKEGCTDVIHFPISFALSSYGENLLNLKEEYFDNVNYHVFNCRTGAMIEGYCAHYAEIMANKDYTVEEIFNECEKFVQNSATYLIVDDLKYLVKNGRLNAASGLIGSLIKIKPILKLDAKGTIDPFEKVRTHNKAVDRMLELVKEDTKNAKRIIVQIQHSARHDEANELKVRCLNELPNAVKASVTTVTPTIGCHIGSGVISIAYIICDDLKEADDLIESVIK